MNMFAEDARLPADIKMSAIPPAPKGHPVLMTGATGFVGAYILAEVLRGTDHRVVCLARAQDDGEAAVRVRRNLQAHGVWRDSWSDRITGLCGNLAAPRLGLSELAWVRLASQIGLIIHNGAQVNFVAPYAALKAANVDATVEMLRLATSGRLKPFHHISTVGVIWRPPGDVAPVAETDDPGDPRMLANGYDQSKWVADRIVAEAIRQGLPGSLYRLGLVSGEFRTGTYAPRDFLSSMLIGSLQMGAFPDFDWPIPMLAVDVAARMVAGLIGGRNTLGQIYHVVHPHPFTGRELARLALLRGFKFRVLPWEAWRSTAVQPDRLIGSDLSDYADFLRTAHDFRIPHLLMDNVRAAVPELVRSCPSQRKLLGRYMEYFIRNGRLAAPDRRAGLRWGLTYAYRRTLGAYT